MGVTQVGLIADDPIVIKLLPQYALRNERLCSPLEAGTMRHALPPPRQLLRLRSAWINTDVLCCVLRETHRAIKPVLGGRLVILLMDTAPSHLRHAVLQLLRRLGWKLVYVTARLTWALQPLDVYAFATFKYDLKRRYQREQLRLGQCCPSPSGWILCLAAGNRDWKASFAGCGFSPEQLGCRGELLGWWGLSSPATLPPLPPA